MELRNSNFCHQVRRTLKNSALIWAFQIWRGENGGERRQPGSRCAPGSVCNHWDLSACAWPRVRVRVEWQPSCLEGNGDISSLNLILPLLPSPPLIYSADIPDLFASSRDLGSHRLRNLEPGTVSSLIDPTDKPRHGWAHRQKDSQPPPPPPRKKRLKDNHFISAWAVPYGITGSHWLVGTCDHVTPLPAPQWAPTLSREQTHAAKQGFAFKRKSRNTR